jgi:hypothetical protein
MNTIGFAARVLAAWLWLVVVHAALGALLSSSSSAPENAAPWFLLSNLFIAGVLCFLAVRSHWRGTRMALALSGIPAVISLMNYLEGMVFLTGATIDWRTEILRACLVAALTVPLWPLLFRKLAGDARPDAEQSARQKLGRFVIADFAYPLLYFAAGMMVFPFVRDFYATQTIPPFGALLALQLLVRGPIFVAICWLMTRMLDLPRTPRVLTVGVAFTILSGIALIIPSAVFPDPVRWAHFVEVTVSNFIFGVTAAWLWGAPSATRELVRRAA